MNVIHDSSLKVPIKLWTDGVPIEDEAIAQLRNVAKLPFVYRNVAVMPDVHAGKGCTVGAVIATYGAIIPACVGVDLGCGMIAQRTTLTANDLPDSLKSTREAIEKAVPHGRTDNGGPNDRGGWGNLPAEYARAWNNSFAIPYGQLLSKHPKAKSRNDANHLGTLGTGNHFIEVCLDEEDSVWVILHSGSRGLGNRIGTYFIEKAQQEMEKWFIHLPDRDLAYLPEGSPFFQDYMDAVNLAQDFAAMNRELMMSATLSALQQMVRPFATTETAVNCHHNYVAKEHHFGRNVFVTRKGAVRAREGDLGIIPGSMGVQSFIVRGKGNSDSFHSCSHGAGRKMSRTKARAMFTVEDHIKATEGVECRKDVEVLDETPGAYKDIGAVMAAQSDLVEIVHTLKQVCCVKG